MNEKRRKRRERGSKRKHKYTKGQVPFKHQSNFIFAKSKDLNGMSCSGKHLMQRREMYTNGSDDPLEGSASASDVSSHSD